MQGNDRTTKLDWFWMILIACLAIVIRIYPHWWNVTPVGALALFAGCRFRPRIGLMVPVVVMIISDIALYQLRGDTPFNVAVYLAFCLYALGGRWFVKVNSPLRIGVTAIGCSVLFFLITNFESWLTMTDRYARSLVGLMNSYVAGLPFFRAEVHITGELVYCAIVFGGYLLVRQALTERAEVMSSASSDRG